MLKLQITDNALDMMNCDKKHADHQHETGMTIGFDLSRDLGIVIWCLFGIYE